MFCQNCGREVEEGKPCVCQTIPADNQQPPPYYPPAYQPMNTEPATPAIHILRKHGSSTLMLVLAIILSVTCVSSILSVVFLGNSLDLATTFTNDPAFTGFKYYAQGMDAIIMMVMIGSLIALIPSIITAISVWLFRSACSKPKDQFVSTTALTIIKTVKIVCSVLAIGFISVYLLLVIVLSSSILPQLSDTSYVDMPPISAGAVGAVMAILIIAMIIIVALLVLDLVFFVKTVGAVTQTARTGVANNKISMYLIVINIISGSVMVISAFVNLSMGPATVINSLIAASSSIIAAIILLKYRGEMTNLIVAQAPPMNGQPFIQPPVLQGAVCRNCHNVYDRNMDVCPRCGMQNQEKFNNTNNI